MLYMQLTMVATVVGNLGFVGRICRSEETQVFGEYCQWEAFEPHCDGADVIIMQSALYGRMRIGRCVEAEGRLIDVMQKDALYLGCSADVLPVVDGRCSGQSRCYLKVADFRSTRPCYVGLEMYLEASYSCARVVENGDKSCTVVVSDDPVHVPLSQGHATDCGTHSRPWRFEATPGEQLRLNLLQFKQSTSAAAVVAAVATAPFDDDDVEFFQQDEPSSADARRRPSAPTPATHPDGSCLPVGYLKETPTDVTNPICARRNRRNTFLYESSANSVDLVLTLEDLIIADSLKIGRFFISFEVVGCPNLQPPSSDAWMERNGSEAIYGCFGVQHTWHLTCRDREWSGVMGNCTQQTVLADIGRAEEKEHFIKHVLFMTIIVGSCLAVFLTMLCIATIVLQRRERNRRLKDERAKCAAQLTSTYYGAMHPVVVVTNRTKPCTPRARTAFLQTGDFRSRTIRPSETTLTSTNEIYFRTLPSYSAFAENDVFSIVRQTIDADDFNL